MQRAAHATALRLSHQWSAGCYKLRIRHVGNEEESNSRSLFILCSQQRQPHLSVCGANRSTPAYAGVRIALVSQNFYCILTQTLAVNKYVYMRTSMLCRHCITDDELLATFTHYIRTCLQCHSRSIWALCSSLAMQESSTTSARAGSPVRFFLGVPKRTTYKDTHRCVPVPTIMHHCLENQLKKLPDD